VNQLLREILGDTLVVIDDDRLTTVAITDVQVDTELRQAVVYFDNLDGAETDAIVLEAFDDLRGRLKVAIGKEARIRRVPELVFRPDPGVRAGEQIDEVLRTMPAVPEREHDLSAYDFGDDETDADDETDTDARDEDSVDGPDAR
jgi:ribosome-binding factor A